MASLTVSELRSALSDLSLDSRGNKQTLKARLAKHKRSALTTPPLPRIARARPDGQSYDSYLVFDVEATCELIQGNPKLAFSYPNEIIEWPVILLQWKGHELVQVDEFHSFVKPKWNPQLSSFCTELTGITQEQVDDAPRFQKLLNKFEQEFILPHQLFTKENKTVWITDGPWDLRDFVAKTCYLSNVARPDWLAGEIIDLKLAASHFFTNLRRKNHQDSPPAPPSPSSSASPPSPPPPLSTSTPVPRPTIVSVEAEPVPPSPPPVDGSVPTYLANSSLVPPPDLSIPSLLSALTLAPFQGRLHSGISDCRNLVRIVLNLVNDRGFELRGNRVVPDGGKGGRERRWGWMGKNGEVKWEGHKRYEERKRIEREVEEKARQRR